MGRADEDEPVLECPRLALVGVGAKVLRAGDVRGHESPFHPGRKTRPSPAADAGLAHLGDDVLGRHRGQSFAGGCIPAATDIVLEPPGLVVNGEEPDGIVSHGP